MANRLVDEFEENDHKEAGPKARLCVKHGKKQARRMMIDDLIAKPVQESGSAFLKFAPQFLANVRKNFDESLGSQSPSPVGDYGKMVREFVRTKIKKGRAVCMDFLESTLSVIDYVAAITAALVESWSVFVDSGGRLKQHDMVEAYLEERIRKPLEKALGDFIRWIPKNSLELSFDDEDESFARIAERERNLGSPLFALDKKIWTEAIETVKDRNSRSEKFRGYQRFVGLRFFIAAVRRYRRMGGRVNWSTTRRTV